MLTDRSACLVEPSRSSSRAPNTSGVCRSLHAPSVSRPQAAHLTFARGMQHVLDLVSPLFSSDLGDQANLLLAGCRVTTLCTSHYCCWPLILYRQTHLHLPLYGHGDLPNRWHLSSRHDKAFLHFSSEWNLFHRFLHCMCVWWEPGSASPGTSTMSMYCTCEPSTLHLLDRWHLLLHHHKDAHHRLRN